MVKYSIIYYLGFIILFLLIIYISLSIWNRKIRNNKINYKIENFDNNKIPKIIIQTWKTNIIPLKYKNDVNSIKKYNPNYKYLFFNDDDIEKFLIEHYKDTYYQSFKKLPVVIQKIDYFRYIAVYHYGGFYFDLDMKGFFPLDELLNYQSVFPIDQNIDVKKCTDIRYNHYCNKGLNFLLGQYAFGAKPQDPFIKKLIDIIHNSVDYYVIEYKKIKNNKSKKLQHQYIYSTTGPDFVTNVYYNYSNKDSIHILHYDLAQYFGKFAKHNYYGTWK
jgi:mannosyltransferase OCH1-like enzyme